MVAGRDAVEKLLKSKTPFKDSEAIDLYEFATSYSQTEYGKTIGVLRANAVKASPNDKDSAKRSFLACVNNGDWEHAQQVCRSSAYRLFLAKMAARLLHPWIRIFPRSEASISGTSSRLTSLQ